MVSLHIACALIAECDYFLTTDDHILKRTELFVALIQREPFDYTKWREGLDKDLTIDMISRKAMQLRK
ncbi:MAG: hypothetical protein DRP70_16250 [Spirochaetes bacterium]|nr:MAG: hypothetical protein DRP70_16250 [Spirochaetota bacterium]